MHSTYLTAFSCRVLATFAALVAGVASLRLYAVFLEVEAVGVAGVLLQIFAYLPLLDGGFRTTINRLLLAHPTGSRKQDLLKFGQTAYFLFGLIALLFALGAMSLLAWSSGAHAASPPVLFYLAMALTGAWCLTANSQMGLLLGLGAQHKLYLFSAVNSLMNLVLLYTGFELGWGIWAIPFSLALPALLLLPGAIILIRWIEPSFRVLAILPRHEFGKLFHEFKGDAWACFRSQVSITLLFSLDLILVFLIAGPHGAAVYFVLVRIFGIVRTFLQAVSEVSWPLLVGQENEQSGRMVDRILRVNAWVYGAVMGALLMTLPLFLTWFMGPDYNPGSLLVLLLAGRFLVTGLSSPAAYALIGMGEFRSVARCVERELAASLLLGLILGLLIGVPGIAAAFWLATAFGTLLPIFLEFARKTARPPAKTIIQVWWRAGLSFAISGAAALAWPQPYWNGIPLVLGGILAAIFAITAGVVLSCLRLRCSPPSQGPRFSLPEILRKI